MKRTIAATIAAAGFVLVSSAASALPSVDIIWRETGSNEIGTLTTPTATASSIVTADIVLTSDSVGVVGVFISIEFDTGELQAISGGEFSTVKLPGMGNTFSPLSLGVIIDNGAGLITNFEQTTLATGLIGPVSRTLGSIRFHVVDTAGSTDDIDVIASLQNTGIDEISTPSGPGAATFGGASVTPEPTTALLVLAGLAGLGYAGRRSLR